MKIFQFWIGLFLAFASVSAQGKFDWSPIINVSLPADAVGNQILHFNPKNKHYTESQDALQFVETYLCNAIPLGSDADVLRYGSDAVSISGVYLEMGVCTGKTINFIAALNPHQTIYGFDSFLGLPEDWIRGDKIIPKGTFGAKVPFLPTVLHNVILCKGWFKDVLPVFKQETLKGSPIAFLHFDCDIYSSTAEVFSILGDHIQEGTVIVFDEFYNYPGSVNHEYKAFMEFLDKSHFAIEYLAYNVYHEQVAVKIKAK